MDFYIQYNVGRAKYCVSYDTGTLNKDGSKFYAIALFKSKKKMNEFIKTKLVS